MAIGNAAMAFATGSSTNVAIGVDAMENSLGSATNIAIGNTAMRNGSGINNVAIGNVAMGVATGSSTNVAIGFQSMQNAMNASKNVAIGYNTMRQSTGAANNVAIGTSALQFCTTGNNVAIGTSALSRNLTGSTNIAIGNTAGNNFTGGESNNIDIGNAGILGDQGWIRIGTAGSQTGCVISGIRGVTTNNANAIAVLIDSSGQLGTTSSSARYKKDIADMNSQQEKMLKLRPVTFSYKGDSSNNKQYGLIAEEVNEVYPEIVVRDEAGEIYSVNYMALIPLLLKQIQELEARVQVQDQGAKYEELKELLARVIAVNNLTV